MKIKVISRNEAEYKRESTRDLKKLERDLDPEAHPFQQAREYTRALNATKLDKIFAKPFVCSFDQHMDSIWRIATVPSLLTTVFSGCCDGEIRAWNLTSRHMAWRARAHQGFVRGLSVNKEGTHVLSCGDDKAIRIWNLNSNQRSHSMAGYEDGEVTPELSILSKTGLMDLSCTWDNTDVFATCGAQIDLWSTKRSKPIHSFEWTAETVQGVEYNPVEHNILCGWNSGCQFMTYDTRTKSETNSMKMAHTVNCAAWNPQEAYTITLGSEDANAYTFDMRKMNKAKKVHVGHVQAVQSIAYAPTGREFVTGGYDCMIRIWRAWEGKSRALYHTKRMQRIYSVAFSADNRFVLSGSDDTNLRVWKARASQPLQKLKPPEQRKLDYYEKLKKKFQHMPEIRRISKHQHMPRWIKKRTEEQRTMRASDRRKENNRIRHSKPGSIKKKIEKEKSIYKSRH